MECQNIRTRLLSLLIAIALTSCLKEDELKLPFETFTPMALDDGWPVSSPSEQGLDSSKLNATYRTVHEDDDLWQIRSLLVFRNECLVAESYTKDGHDIDTPRAVWSCTKQVVGILTGMAIERGYIQSTASTVGQYLPHWAARYPDKQDITIDNLLKMKSGIDFENDGANSESAMLLKQIPANSLDFIFNLPYRAPQGTLFNYNDGDPQIISAIVQQQTGKPLAQWAQDVLISKLGIKNWDWISYKDSVTMGALGIMTTPRELAKIGQLILNDGQWNGTQIVSAEWIEQMTDQKVDGGETQIKKPFGYYWWIDNERGIVFMYGHGGQYVLLNGAKSLMVVITAEPNTQGGFSLTLDKALELYDGVYGSIKSI